MITNQYSKIIQKYAFMKFDTFLIPDLIMTKEGVACGDRMVLIGQIDDENLTFDFTAHGACLLCKAMCNYIICMFNNKKLDDILMNVKQLHNRIISNKGYIYKLFDLDINTYQHRYDCLFAPIKLFLDFLTEISTNSFEFKPKTNTLENMECDACVSTCKVNWNKDKKIVPQNIYAKEYSLDYLKSWLSLGKIVLNDSEKNLLKKLCLNMTEDDHKFLSGYKIDGFILYHLINNYPQLIDKQWERTAYRVQKNDITKGYIEKIKTFIIKEKLDIYFIKGCITKKYYNDPSFRVQSDCDLVATNSRDTFKLASYLLRDGFRVRSDLFSIKKMNHDGNKVVSGHFHMQKLIEDTYLVELDISFPAYPVNRIDLYYPKYCNNEILLEDQIIMTLLHLFKHHKVYMKDINDLYYMLREKNIDLEYLNQVISKNQLSEFFALVIMYIYHNYYNNADHDRLEELIKYFKIDRNILESYLGWPYDPKMHLKIKQKDYKERTLVNNEHDRTYLFPVAMFYDEFDFSILKSLEKNYTIFKITNTIYEISTDEFTFYLTGMGIFINSYFDTTSISRRSVIKTLKKFMQEIGIKDTMSIPYAPYIPYAF